MVGYELQQMHRDAGQREHTLEEKMKEDGGIERIYTIFQNDPSWYLNVSKEFRNLPTNGPRRHRHHISATRPHI